MRSRSSPQLRKRTLSSVRVVVTKVKVYAMWPLLSSGSDTVAAIRRRAAKGIVATDFTDWPRPEEPPR